MGTIIKFVYLRIILKSINAYTKCDSITPLTSANNQNDNQVTLCCPKFK